MKFLFAVVVAKIYFSTSIASAQSALYGIDSGRYEVRSSTKVIDSATQKNSKTVAAKKDKRRAPASEESGNPVVELTLKPSSGSATSTEPDSEVSKAEPKLEAKVEKIDLKKEPAIGEQMESIFDSRLSDVLTFYQNHIHPDDIRNNQIEADLLPSLVHLDARSNYSYRRYTTQYVSLGLKATAWFTPRIGLIGAFATSLAADVDSGNANKDKVNAKFENMDMGFSFRSFEGLSRRADSTEFMLKLMNSKTTIPSDEVDRASLASSGLGLGVRTRFVGSGQHKWVLGGMLFPRISHSETATSAAGRSGQKGESVKVEFELGGEFESSRRSQLIWNLGYGFERNTFTGQAINSDPMTGVKPTNVGVSTTTLSFGLGYRWGR